MYTMLRPKNDKRAADANPEMEEFIKSIKATSDPNLVGKLVVKEMTKYFKEKKPLARLLKQVMTAKSKSTFEEIQNEETSESLCWCVMDFLNEKTLNTNNTILFKFLYGQNILNVKSRSLIKKIVEKCLGCAGRFLTQDKFVFGILHKFLLNRPEEIKNSRLEITDKVLSLTFLYFTFLQNKYQRSSPDFLRTYADLLKLYQHFTKEILELKTASLDKKQKFVAEETFEYLSCLVELCKLNMFVGSQYAESNVFGGQRKIIMKLLTHAEVKERIDSFNFKEFTEKDPEIKDPAFLSASENLSSCYSTSESQSDKLRPGQEAEGIDKIKINSSKIISILLRGFPKIFIDNKLWTHILPAATINLTKFGLNPKQIVPQLFFNSNFVSSLQENYKVFVNWQINNGVEADSLDTTIQISKFITNKRSKGFSSTDNLAMITNAKMKILNELRAKGRLKITRQLLLFALFLFDRNFSSGKRELS